jgi:hypothetical protein
MAEDLNPIIIGGVLAAAGIGIGVAVLLGAAQPVGGNVGTRLTISVAPNPALVGQPIGISGKLTRADTGVGLYGMTVIIETSTDQMVWLQVTTSPTASDGTYGAQVMFQVAGTYYLRARFTGA